MRLLPRPLSLLPGPAAFILETFHSLHLLFRFAAQGVNLSIDFLLRAGYAATGALICPDGFHHLPETIGLDWFRDRPNGHLYRSRGKLDLLRHLQPSVRLHSAFNDDSRSIHDIHLAFSYRWAG